MANIFAILAAIVLAVSAFLAVKNYQAYYNEDLVSPGIIQKRQEQEKDRENNLDTIARLQAELEETNKTRVETETTSAEKLTQLQEQEKKNKEIEAKIATNKQSIDENQRKIDETESRLKEIGNISDLVPKLKQLKADIEKYRASIGESEAKLAQLTAEVRRTDTVIVDYKDQNQKHANKESYFTSTRIRSVFGNWGFVTLSAGNTAGVVQDSVLDVVRGGEVIAKLFVTAVESSSAAADLIPDSLAEDTVLMAGDTVVPTKKEKAAEAKPAGGADKPAEGAPAAPTAPDAAPAAPDAAPAAMPGEPAAPAAPAAPGAPVAPADPAADPFQ